MEIFESLTPKNDYDENEDAPFKRAYILPIGTKTIEKSLTPRGHEVEDVIPGKICGKIIITLPKTRIGEGGKAMLIDTPYVINIPGRTDDNEAIRDRQPLREVNRALYFASGNGALYRLVGITDDQYAEEKKSRRMKETEVGLKRATERRSAIPEPMAMGKMDSVSQADRKDEYAAESALRSVGA
jgi:hypothetical protein